MAAIRLRPKCEQSACELLRLGALWGAEMVYALADFYTYVREGAFKLVCKNFPEAVAQTAVEDIYRTLELPQPLAGDGGGLR